LTTLAKLENPAAINVQTHATPLCTLYFYGLLCW